MSDIFSTMKDADMPLLDRVEAALARVRSRQGLMRIPVEATDMDIVVCDCRAEIHRLRAEIAALKANDPLAEMWAALAEYQEQADKDGHGESWAKMCSERTEEAAERAWWASRRVLARDEARVAARSAGAAASTHSATDAIKAIRRAKEAR